MFRVTVRRAMTGWVKPIDPETDQVFEFDPPDLTVIETDNPVIAELLGPDGQVIRQWLEREPIGYRQR